MEKTIKDLTDTLLQVQTLQKNLKDSLFWINKAAKETNFIPLEEDWISVRIDLYKIQVSVHHKNNPGSVYWINGEWFDTPFPKEIPSLRSINRELQN